MRVEVIYVLNSSKCDFHHKIIFILSVNEFTFLFHAKSGEYKSLELRCRNLEGWD